MSVFDIEYLSNNTRLLHTASKKVLNCATTIDLDRPSGSFQQFCLKISVADFPVCDRKSTQCNEG